MHLITRILTTALAAVLTSAAVLAQNTPAGPFTIDPNTHQAKSDLVFGSGRTGQFAAGSTFRFDAGASFAGSSSAFLTAIGAQPLDSDLTSIAAIATTSFGRSLLALASSNNAVLTTDGAGAWVLSTTLPVGLSSAFSGGDVTKPAGSGTLTLTTTGVTAGTYKSVTVDSKGRVSAGTNPATLAGYGITDALGAPMRNALAPRGGVALDGIAGARIFSTLTGQSIGADAFSVVCVLRVPTSAPAASQGIWGLGSSLSDFVSSSGPNASLSIDAAGGLDVSIGRSSGVYIVSTVSGFVTKYAGKVVVIAVVFDRVSTDPLIYIDGSAQVVTRLFSQGAAWTDSITSTYFGLGWQDTSQGSRFVGAIYSASVYNLALSASDQLEVAELGGAVPERYKWGSQSLGVSAFANGPSPGYRFTSFTSATTTGFIGVANPAASPYCSVSFPARRVVAGTKFRLRMTFVRNNSVSSPGVLLACLFGDPSTGTERINFLNEGANDFMLTSTRPASLGSFTFTAASGNTNTLFDVTVSGFYGTQLGAIAHYSLDDGIGYQLLDASINKLHAIGTDTGLVHVTAKQRGVLHFTTATNGNQQLLGQTALPPNARITSWTIDSSGSATVSLGNASAGAQFLSAGSITTGLTDVPLLTRFDATNNLWVASNSTAALQHTVYYEIVD